ncbi:dTDP-4-dehydrorhamnose 3,5-epimerase [Entomospira culicis]|nr:dTDP-4-dehydrorhamnose 3,5-epimerase [Entomospira culicis]WDI37977.1 dTDP-4-dehydrorhamnose 3,5-epimerase [Entomospira culicis]WDI39600.1 dTDP-4-dehydrorhamnose 3,5-epimerase [Entomospira culicis]
MQVRRFANGLMVITPPLYRDERGCFMELSKASTLRALGLPDALVQSNLSWSKYGVLRGLHDQLEPYAQGKLVSVLQGAIWDVVVDIRPQSATYLSWFSFYLTAKSMRQLWIPKGFLHGFYALGQDNLVLYHTSAEYHASHERSVAHDSPIWSVPWPRYKILSAKDAQAPHFQP